MAAAALSNVSAGSPSADDLTYDCPTGPMMASYAYYDGTNMSGEITAGLTPGDTIAILVGPSTVWIMKLVSEDANGRLFARGLYRWWVHDTGGTFFYLADPDNNRVNCPVRPSPTE